MVSRVRLALCACVALAAAAIARAVDTHVFYYNDVTRESRWDDPEGLATHLDDAGRPYWVDADTGESTYDSPRHSAVARVGERGRRERGTGVLRAQGDAGDDVGRSPKSSRGAESNRKSTRTRSGSGSRRKARTTWAKTSRSTAIPSTSVRTKAKASAAPTRTSVMRDAIPVRRVTGARSARRAPTP